MVRSSKIMEIIEEDGLCDKAAQTGEYLQTSLKNIAAKNNIISNVRGKGLLTAFDFPDKTIRDNFINYGLENNIMYLGCGDRSIRFRPALIIENKHIDEGMNMLETILPQL